MLEQLSLLERIAFAIESIASGLATPRTDLLTLLRSPATSSAVAEIVRAANAALSEPPDVVDSSYLAKRLGCTTTWIAQLARSGQIPSTCIVPGTGNGRLWKFRRAEIEQWLGSR